MSKELEEQREVLKRHLENIVDTALEIRKEMSDVPHSRGAAYRSIKPKSGQHVIDLKNGFGARVQGTDGNFYDISVYQDENHPKK